MDIEQSFQNAMDDFASYLPKVVAFLVILLIGWIVAKVLRRIVTRVLARVGVDRLSERAGLRRFSGNLTASSLTGTLLYVVIMLMTLQLAFAAFGPNPVSELLQDLVAWIPQLFVAGIIMMIGMMVANMVFDLVSNAMAEVSYGRTLGRMAQIFIIAVAGIAALNQIGVASSVTTPILIAVLAMVAGVVIVGVGGGLIVPMRSRWERMLGAAEEETTKLRSTLGNRQESTSAFGQPSYRSSQYGDTADAQRQAQDQTQRPTEQL